MERKILVVLIFSLLFMIIVAAYGCMRDKINIDSHDAWDSHDDDHSTVTGPSPTPTPNPTPSPTPAPGSVTTLSASGITTNSATLNGSASCGSSANSWFEWGTSTTLGSTACFVNCASIMTCTVNTLNAGTTYYFKAAATGASGSTLTFTTSPGGGPGPNPNP